MKKKYVLSVAYKNGRVARSDKSYQCKISAGRLGFMNYAFISAPVAAWERREENSPVLEVQELKDNQGNVAFLEIGILKWSGSIPGVVKVNEHIIWPPEQIRSGRLQNSVGLVKKIPVELFEKPEATSVHVL